MKSFKFGWRSLRQSSLMELLVCIAIVVVTLFFPSGKTVSAATKSQPEIQVFLDGNLINGTRASSQLVATYSHQQGRPLGITVRNAGTANLVISNWVVPQGFVGQRMPTTFTLAPGRSFTYQVYCNRSSLGIKGWSPLSFSTNDLDERFIQISLRGKVLAPPLYSSDPRDRAQSFSEASISESRPGTIVSIDFANGRVSQNTSFTISDNRGMRQHFDGSLRKVTVYAGKGVTVDDWSSSSLRVIVIRQ
jgi:hypothetical protein